MWFPTFFCVLAFIASNILSVVAVEQPSSAHLHHELKHPPKASSNAIEAAMEMDVSMQSKHVLFHTQEELDEYERKFSHHYTSLHSTATSKHHSDFHHIESIHGDERDVHSLIPLPVSSSEITAEETVASSKAAGPAATTPRPSRAPTTMRPTREPTFSLRPTREPTASMRPTREPTFSLRPTREPTHSVRPTQVSARPTQVSARPTPVSARPTPVSVKPTVAGGPQPSPTTPQQPTTAQPPSTVQPPTGSQQTAAPTSPIPPKNPTLTPTVAPSPLTAFPTRLPTVGMPIPVFNVLSMKLNGSYHRNYGSLKNSPKNAMTVSFFVNTTKPSTTVFSQGRDQNNIYREILMDITSKGYINYWEYDGYYGIDIYSNSKVTTGKRTHVVLVKDGSYGKIYINGVLENSYQASGSPIIANNISFNLGNDVRSSNRFMTGSLENFYVFNKALTPTQVSYLYSTYFFTYTPSAMPSHAPSNPTFSPTRVPTRGPTNAPPRDAVYLAGTKVNDLLGFSMIDAIKASDASNITGADLRHSFMSLKSVINKEHDAIVSAIFRNQSNGAAFNSITWNPTHDSIYFNILDFGNTFELLVSNREYWSDTEISQRIPIAITGYYGATTRYAAFGANPFALPFTNSNFIMKNVITWLNNGVDPSKSTDRYKIVTSLIPGTETYWFPHDVPTTNWFKKYYPSAAINEINACDNANLQQCLVGANLLVLGVAANSNTNIDTLKANVLAFVEAGGNLLFINHYNDVDQVANPILSMFGASADSNYWSRYGVKAADPFASYSTSLDTLYNMVQTLDGITPVVAADVCNDNQWMACNVNPDWNRKIKYGVDSLKQKLSSFDNSGADLFSTRISYVLPLKMLVLLGDKYRSARGATDENTHVIKYPRKLNDYVALAEMMFADSSVLYRRPIAPAQDDLGSVFCSTWSSLCADHKKFPITVTRYNNVLVTEPFLFKGGIWTTSGVFAVPGVPFTVSRLDDRDEMNVYIATWYQRAGSTKSLDSMSNGNSQYHRPQYMRSPDILVPLKGQTITVTAPYGGPIYLVIRTNGKSKSSTAVDTSAKLKFSNVARHPSILNSADEQEVNAFPQELKKNPIPIVDLKMTGFEIHMRSDYLTASLKYIDFMQNYSGPSGLLNLLYDIRINFVEHQYTLAGFKAPGKELTETLSADNQLACKLMKWNCTDASIHSFTNIQHANYDERANCGNGCSGNPFDMDWTISATGWGESHELGHNMQTHYICGSQLNPAGGNRDDWGDYISRCGENSNNIFPYHNKWRFWRVFKGYNGTIPYGSSWHGHFIDFCVLQSALARVNKTVNGEMRTVVFDDQCRITHHYPVGTDPKVVAGLAVYGGNGDNDALMALYIQLPFIFAKKRIFKNQVLLNNGFEVYTLLYQGGRILSAIDREDKWYKYRDTIGFGLFNRTCYSQQDEYCQLYNGGSISNINSNDYMLVMLTYLSGYDFRPYFDIRGVMYSTLAEKQVLAHIQSGVANNGPIPTDYYITDDFPPADLISAPVEKLPLDGKTGWTYKSWSVANCASKYT